jgi:DNA-directed RNA polymerase subunit RPC12/RpoP
LISAPERGRILWEREAEGRSFLITYTCPSCTAKCSVGDQFAGRKMKCPKCGARIRHHPGAAIELLSAGKPPAPPPVAAPAGGAPAPWSSMDPAAPAPATGTAPPPAAPEGEKKGSTVAVAIVPELVGKLVSQSESKQNIMVIWGAVAFLALAMSVVGLLLRDLVLGVAPVAVALVAAFLWLKLRAAKPADATKAKPAAKDEEKTEALPKI